MSSAYGTTALGLKSLGVDVVTTMTDDSARSSATLDTAIERAKAGDPDSFRKLWTATNPVVLRYLRVLSRSNDVEDIAAATWVEVVRSLRRFEGGEAQFRAWVLTIARNRRIDLLRYNARRPIAGDIEDIDPVVEEPGPEDLIAGRDATHRAVELIATLPHDQGEAVALRIIADLDVSRVADLMGKSEGAVRVLCHRGLKNLRDKIENTGGEW